MFLTRSCPNASTATSSGTLSSSAIHRRSFSRMPSSNCSAVTFATLFLQNTLMRAAMGEPHRIDDLFHLLHIQPVRPCCHVHLQRHIEWHRPGHFLLDQFRNY